MCKKLKSYIIYTIYVLFLLFNIYENKGYSMIKEIDGVIYIGGRNMLSSYTLSTNKSLIVQYEEHYTWEEGIINGSSKGIYWQPKRWPDNFNRGPTSYAFDNCLNWKQQHPDESFRDNGYDFPRWFYHSPSGDFETMSYTCLNSFIKAVQPRGNDRLWVCGTFGAFPRAFAVNKTTLKFIEFLDTNVMSCSRYVDEPMATYVVNKTGELYVASGWGLYRPHKKNPDVPNNNSTMLYSQWRLYRNLYTLPAAMGVVLSSDVNFIDVVKETDDHLYFFGHEINSQYGLNNQDDRNAWQSFLLRICKDDLGFQHIPFKDSFQIKNAESNQYSYSRFDEKDFKISPSPDDIKYMENLPTRHFVTPMKIHFGCYISKRPRAISDNQFWGETSVIYLNKLADVVFDPKRNISFISKNEHKYVGCNPIPHSQIPLLGLFNGPGIVGTGMEPTGALCQLQINRNVFVEEGVGKSRYNMQDNMNVLNAHEEIMAISSTSTDNFFGKSIQRTNGFTLYPWWNYGVMIGRSDNDRKSYKNVFSNIGKCHDPSFYKQLNWQGYYQIQNFTNTAWPNEMANRLTSMAQAMCQYYAVELLNFNATFIMPGVEFKRVFVIADNITNYQMHPVAYKADEATSRRITSPLMIVGIVSTTGVFYRVVLCDFDNGMLNRGINQTSGEWYNWCIFRHTNQPYLYRQFFPMEKRKRGEPALYRASSLLLEKKIVTANDSSSYPINRDPQFHVVKGILRKDDFIHVVTTDNVHRVSLLVDCSLYTQCIDCASDPSCMWQINNGKCAVYDSTTYKDKEFVQDVLDRGFKCSLSIVLETFKIPKNHNILSCDNAGFWRGKLVWKIGSNEITNDNDRFLRHGNSLFIINNYQPDNNITVYGVNDDHDKLYGGEECQWIVAKYGSSRKNVSLCLFEFYTDTTLWTWNYIFSVVGYVLFIVAVILFVVMLRKLRSLSCHFKAASPTQYEQSVSNGTDTELLSNCVDSNKSV